MQHTKSKERVSKLGEVYTPAPIVDDMHALIGTKKVAPGIWSDPTMIYLEPTCGNGQFVVAAVQKKIDSGLTPYEAVNTVFGMDIMQDNVDECRERVYALVKPLVRGKRAMDDIRCVIVNNIFPVKDSLAFMAAGKWEAKRFFKDDPTETGGQVLCAETRAGVLERINKNGVLI